MTEGKKIVAEPAPLRALERPGASAWLWPHLLSLDAPLVAVGWQAWWAQAQGVRLQWFHHAILGLCVWMIYLADRLDDTRSVSPQEWGTPRHAFYHRHRVFAAWMLGAVIFTLTILAPRYLSASELGGGAALLAVAGGYFWLIHGRGGWPIRLPKEAVVGGLFALGVGYFVAQKAMSPLLCLRTAFFAALCFFNCALISRWERTLRDRRQRSSLINAFPRLTERLGLGAALLAGLAFIAGLAVGRPVAFLPLELAAAGLWALDASRNRIPASALRVLADVALLTPWLFLWR